MPAGGLFTFISRIMNIFVYIHVNIVSTADIESALRSIFRLTALMIMCESSEYYCSPKLHI